MTLITSEEETYELIHAALTVADLVDVKPVDTMLTGVEVRTTRYSDGLPDWLNLWSRLLKMLYVSTRMEARISDRLVREPRTNAEIFDRNYLRLMWDSALVRTPIETCAKATPGIHKINQRDLGSIKIPLPPLDVQTKLAAELERLDSVVTAQERAIEASLVRSERMRQAVLKRAFESRLLPALDQTLRVQDLLQIAQ